MKNICQRFRDEIKPWMGIPASNILRQCRLVHAALVKMARCISYIVLFFRAKVSNVKIGMDAETMGTMDGWMMRERVEMDRTIRTIRTFDAMPTIRFLNYLPAMRDRQQFGAIDNRSIEHVVWASQLLNDHRKLENHLPPFNFTLWEKNCGFVLKWDKC